MSREFNPIVSSTSDGMEITLCRILEAVAGVLNVSDRNPGANGGKIVPASTASGSGTWYALQFVTSGTLTAYAGNITGTVTGVTFPAGFVLYGNTTSFTTGAGTSVVAYTI
jgi:hypothetical protein